MAMLSMFNIHQHASKLIPRDACAAMATLAALAVPLAAPLAATPSAQPFSADLSRRDASGHILTGRLLVAGDKIRIEQPNLPTGFFIISGGAKAAYFVKPDRQVFMDAQQSSILTEILVPVDPAAPCAQWQAMAVISGSAKGGAAWRCERIGDETRNGHATVRYSMVSPRGRHFSAWIDPQLKFVVRIEAGNGASLELTHLHEAPQPASAFTVPPGFPKFDPQLLIDQMKRSDNYVDPSMDSRAVPLKPNPGPDL
jgi:hypothetical protein